MSFFMLISENQFQKVFTMFLTILMKSWLMKIIWKMYDFSSSELQATDILPAVDGSLNNIRLEK